MSRDSRLLDVVVERDVDLVLLMLLRASSAFREHFLRLAIGLEGGHTLVDVRVSVVAGGRETDVLLVVDLDDSRRVAVMVEDKIDAPVQPGQDEGYRFRGRYGVDAGDWSYFVVCLFAPESYLAPHRSTGKWDACIAIEDAVSWLSVRHDPFLDVASHILAEAVSKRQRGAMVPSQSASEFYRCYRALAALRLPDMVIGMVPDSAGSGIYWPEFDKDPQSDVYLEHVTSDIRRAYGLVRLGFNKQRFATFKHRLPPLPSGVCVEKGARVDFLGIRVPCLDSLRPFDEQADSMEPVFVALRVLSRFRLSILPADYAASARK